MSHILNEWILLSKNCWLIKSHYRYHCCPCFNMIVVNNVHQHLLVALNTGSEKVLLKFRLVSEHCDILFLEGGEAELVHRLRKLSLWLLRESVAFKLLASSLAQLTSISRGCLWSSGVCALFGSPFLSLFICQLFRRFGLLWCTSAHF